jgi:hypothetical protein
LHPLRIPSHNTPTNAKKLLQEISGREW